MAPPHMTKVPRHLWEFEVNKEMWVQKTRLMRTVSDVSVKLYIKYSAKYNEHFHFIFSESRFLLKW